MRRSAPASSRCVAYECRSVCGLTRRSMPAAFAAKRTASQMHLDVSGLSARQPCSWPGKRYVCGRIQRWYSRKAVSSVGLKRHLAAVAALAAFDAEHHALAVDVRDLQLQELASTQARAVERHQHRAVVEILRAGNQPTHFVGTQDRRQPSMPLRGGQLLFQRAPLEDADKEEAQGRHVEAHGPDGELLLLEQMRVVAPERIRARADRGDGPGGSARRCGARAGRFESWSRRSCAGPSRRACAAAVSSQAVPPVTHATPYVLRVTRLPVGRRASGFVLVALSRQRTCGLSTPGAWATGDVLSTSATLMFRQLEPDRGLAQPTGLTPKCRLSYWLRVSELRFDVHS